MAAASAESDLISIASSKLRQVCIGRSEEEVGKSKMNVTCVLYCKVLMARTL